MGTRRFDQRVILLFVPSSRIYTGYYRTPRYIPIATPQKVEYKKKKKNRQKTDNCYTYAYKYHYTPNVVRIGTSYTILL